MRWNRPLFFIFFALFLSLKGDRSPLEGAVNPSLEWVYSGEPQRASLPFTLIFRHEFPKGSRSPLNLERSLLAEHENFEVLKRLPLKYQPIDKEVDIEEISFSILPKRGGEFFFPVLQLAAGDIDDLSPYFKECKGFEKKGDRFYFKGTEPILIDEPFRFSAEFSTPLLYHLKGQKIYFRSPWLEYLSLLFLFGFTGFLITKLVKNEGGGVQTNSKETFSSEALRLKNQNWDKLQNQKEITAQSLLQQFYLSSFKEDLKTPKVVLHDILEKVGKLNIDEDIKIEFKRLFSRCVEGNQMGKVYSGESKTQIIQEIRKLLNDVERGM